MSKTKEQVEAELRGGPVRKAGSTVAGVIFDDPEFQKKMNRWMIGTHISWGISLALTFVGLNELLIAIQQTWSVSNWAFAAVFIPLGGGYLFYQTRKFRKPSL